MNQALDDKIKELTETQKREKTSKKELQASIEALKNDTANKIQELEGKNAGAAQALDQVNNELSNATGQLASAQAALDARTREKNASQAS